MNGVSCKEDWFVIFEVKIPAPTYNKNITVFSELLIFLQPDSLIIHHHDLKCLVIRLDWCGLLQGHSEGLSRSQQRFKIDTVMHSCQKLVCYLLG